MRWNKREEAERPEYPKLIPVAGTVEEANSLLVAMREHDPEAEVLDAGGRGAYLKCTISRPKRLPRPKSELFRSPNRSHESPFSVPRGLHLAAPSSLLSSSARSAEPRHHLVLFLFCPIPNQMGYASRQGDGHGYDRRRFGKCASEFGDEHRYACVGIPQTRMRIKIASSSKRCFADAAS